MVECLISHEKLTLQNKTVISNQAYYCKKCLINNFFFLRLCRTDLSSFVHCYQGRKGGNEGKIQGQSS